MFSVLILTALVTAIAVWKHIRYEKPPLLELMAYG